MNDLVSVIIPMYNSSKTIKRCLESIVNQTYKNIEILVINDGSTDNYKNILDNYKNIKVINQKNKGLSFSRNVGLKKAKGKYILFVDSDDYIKEDLIEKCHQKIIEDNSDLVLFSFYELHYLRVKKRIIDKNYPTRNNIWQYGYAWNKFYKKDIIEKNKISFKYGVIYVEDIIFNVEYIIHSHNISFIKEPLYYFDRTNAKSLSKSADKDFLNIMEKSFPYKLKLINRYNTDIDYKEYLYLFLMRQYITYNSRLSISYFNKIQNIKEVISKFYNSFKEYKPKKYWEKVYMILIRLKMYNTLYIITTILYRLYLL